MKASLLTILFTLIGLSTCVIIRPPANANLFAGSFLVKLRDGVNSKNFTNYLLSGGVLVAINHAYEYLNGFTATIKNDQQLQLLNSFLQVESIEYDYIMHTSFVSQSDATWGLQRISQRNKVTGNTFTYRYDLPAGLGVNAYVIDTGIRTNHSEFGGRAIWGANFVSSESDNTDLNGHGTHVAGTIGSNTYGVAKNVTLVAVKVLNKKGSGPTSGIVAGIEFAIKHCAQVQGIKRCVINLSVGGPRSQMVNDAVGLAVKAGITCCVAAGNDGRPASFYSPASELSAITVAAADKNDILAKFSNYGFLIDIIAPGVDILSTWNDGGTKIISGTSMATPHVTGLAAYLMLRYNLLTSDAVEKKIKEIATPDKISKTLMSLPFLFTNRIFSTVNKVAFNNVQP